MRFDLSIRNLSSFIFIEAASTTDEMSNEKQSANREFITPTGSVFPKNNKNTTELKIPYH